MGLGPKVRTLQGASCKEDEPPTSAPAEKIENLEEHQKEKVENLEEDEKVG